MMKLYKICELDMYFLIRHNIITANLDDSFGKVYCEVALEM